MDLQDQWPAHTKHGKKYSFKTAKPLIREALEAQNIISTSMLVHRMKWVLEQPGMREIFPVVSVSSNYVSNLISQNSKNADEHAFDFDGHHKPLAELLSLTLGVSADILFPRHTFGGTIPENLTIPDTALHAYEDQEYFDRLIDVLEFLKNSTSSKAKLFKELLFARHAIGYESPQSLAETKRITGVTGERNRQLQKRIETFFRILDAHGYTDSDLHDGGYVNYLRDGCRRDIFPLSDIRAHFYSGEEKAYPDVCDDKLNAYYAGDELTPTV